MSLRKLLVLMLGTAILLTSGVTSSFAQGQPAAPANPQEEEEFPGKEPQYPPGSPAALRKANNIKAEESWYNPDYRPYNVAFADLIKLSRSFAKNKFRLALTNYQSGRNILQKMREEVQRFEREQKEAYHLNEKWYWQTIDRVNMENRIISRKKRTAKLAAVTYFTRAINHLDEIRNKELTEHPEYKRLLANVYRWWIINQYDLQNIPQTIDILRRYVDLSPEYEQEFPAHKYLASAYSFKENMIRKYKVGSEQQMEFYKRKKNEHLLRAAELKYGKGSPEYQEIVELVNRDEVIAITN